MVSLQDHLVSETSVVHNSFHSSMLTGTLVVAFGLGKVSSSSRHFCSTLLMPLSNSSKAKQRAIGLVDQTCIVSYFLVQAKG